MTLQTGGFALGEISTRSNPCSFDISIAWGVGILPFFSPDESISRTSSAVIWSLTRGPFEDGGVELYCLLMDTSPYLIITLRLPSINIMSRNSLRN